MTELWHYTCAHGCQAIGETGMLLPIGRLAKPEALAKLNGHEWQKHLVWLTDLDYPMRDALGLTSYVVGCDRTTYRYRVTDASNARRWVRFRRGLPGALDLDFAPGALPMHWWVSLEPVPVVFDPVMERVS